MMSYDVVMLGTQQTIHTFSTMPDLRLPNTEVRTSNIHCGMTGCSRQAYKLLNLRALKILMLY